MDVLTIIYNTASKNCMTRLLPSQLTQNICITFVQRRPNVFDVGPTLYKCYTKVLCLPGCLYTSDRLSHPRPQCNPTQTWQRINERTCKPQ